MATTADYLNKLVEQKNTLADNLVTKGITATHDETLETLVPKVLNITSGESVNEKYYIYNNGVEMNSHTMTIHHKGSLSKKTTNWIYLYGYYMSDLSTDKIICTGYSKLCITLMSDSTKFSYTPKYLKLLCTDEIGATLTENDYTPNGNVLKSVDAISYPDIPSAGTTYEIDISDLSEFYLHFQNVNTDTYILGVWLEREKRAKVSMNFDKWGHTSGSYRYTIDNNGWVSNFYNNLSYVGVAKSFAYTKSFEIMMNFILDTLPARSNVLFGSSISNNFYLAPTLEVQRNAAWAGLSYNGTGWDKNISYNITWETNKEYYLKYSFDVLSKTLKLELSYDGINWNKIAMVTDVEIGYQGKDTEYLEIGGIAQSSNHYFVCGKINIFKSYIKTDDELFWGVQYE